MSDDGQLVRDGHFAVAGSDGVNEGEEAERRLRRCQMRRRFAVRIEEVGDGVFDLAAVAARLHGEFYDQLRSSLFRQCQPGNNNKNIDVQW